MKKYSKELYSKEVLLKAAYSFTDTLYIHLDADDENYIVDLCPKSGDLDVNAYSTFENELIAQENRYIIAEKTKNIREMIIARSLSSTMIDMGTSDDSEVEEYSSEDILQDWFKDE